MARPALPARAGLGFKPEYFAAIAASPAAIGFLEVHAENYMGAGGVPHRQLTRLRRDHALSLHAIGLSIGSAAPPDAAYLARLRALCVRYEPASLATHLAWSAHAGAWLPDLLPLPYNEMTLARLVRHVDMVQEALGRPLLLENPPAYLAPRNADMAEGTFFAELLRRTGAGLLLDLNNLHVAARNLGERPAAALARFPLARIELVHLAGHEAEAEPDGGAVLIDSHAGPVSRPVLDLLAAVLAARGPLPVLLEWDNDLPAWPVLLAELGRIEAMLPAAPALAAD